MKHLTLEKTTSTLTSNLGLYLLNSPEKVKWLTRQEKLRALKLTFWLIVVTTIWVLIWLIR